MRKVKRCKPDEELTSDRIIPSYERKLLQNIEQKIQINTFSTLRDVKKNMVPLKKKTKTA